MHDVYLLLGSNLGDRGLYLQQAIQHIENDIAPVVTKSAVYETQSWGKTDSPDYLNQVILLQTDLSPRAVLQKILSIEQLIGRVREEKWGPRIIDIDLLFYGTAVIDEPGLRVPHPELHKRGFTLAPLAEIAPSLVHPLFCKTILALKNKLEDPLLIKKL